MAFLENLGKKLGEAAQTAAKKSGELVEVTKINLNINSEEDKIEKLYMQIGKKVYDSYNAGAEVAPELAGDCEAIREHEQTIKGLKEKILELKNLKLCSGCGAEIEKTALFCAKCGTKQEVAQTPPKEEAAEVLCPACGAKVQANAAFCAACGNRMA